jgi:hypothetical protein
MPKKAQTNKKPLATAKIAKARGIPKGAKTTTTAVNAARLSEPDEPDIEILYTGVRQENGVTFDKTLYFGQEHYSSFLRSLFARLPPGALTALQAWMRDLGGLSIGPLRVKISLHPLRCASQVPSLVLPGGSSRFGRLGTKYAKRWGTSDECFNNRWFKD